MKFLNPTVSKQEINNYFRTFLDEIVLAFKQMMEKWFDYRKWFINSYNVDSNDIIEYFSILKNSN